MAERFPSPQHGPGRPRRRVARLGTRPPSCSACTVSRVRTMIREHELAAAVPSPGAGPAGAGRVHPGRPRRQGPARAADRAARRRVRRPRVHRLALHSTTTSRAGRSTRCARTAAPRSSAAPRRWPSDAAEPTRGSQMSAAMSGLAALLAGPQEPGIYRWHGAFDVPRRAAHGRARRLALRARRRLARRDQGRVPARGRRGAGLPRATTAQNFDALADCLGDVVAGDSEGWLLLWDGWGPLARDDQRASRSSLSRARHPGQRRPGRSVRGAAARRRARRPGCAVVD